MINSFSEEYEFLSNFFNAPVEYNGLTYKNNEAAFQAQKTLSVIERERFTLLPPGKAKEMGRAVTLRPDWEHVKVTVMYEICKCKFTQHPELGKMLLDTHNEELVEGNYWHDTFWGVCEGIGENNLGKILMRIREELR